MAATMSARYVLHPLVPNGHIHTLFAVAYAAQPLVAC